MDAIEREAVLTLAYGPFSYMCFDGMLKCCSYCCACSQNIMDKLWHDKDCIHQRALTYAIIHNLTEANYLALSSIKNIATFHDCEIIDSEVVYTAKLSTGQTLFVKTKAMQDAIRYDGAFENQILMINYWISAIQAKIYSYKLDRNNPSFWIE